MEYAGGRPDIAMCRGLVGYPSPSFTSPLYVVARAWCALALHCAWTSAACATRRRAPPPGTNAGISVQCHRATARLPHGLSMGGRCGTPGGEPANSHRPICHVTLGPGGGLAALLERPPWSRGAGAFGTTPGGTATLVRHGLPAR